MVQKILLPKLDESMQEATIVAWHVKVGDVVQPGQILYEISTDKANVEVESEVAGTVRHLLVGEEDVVEALGVVAILAEAGEDVPSEMLLPSAPAKAGSGAAAVTSESLAVSASVISGPDAAIKGGRRPASPRAKALAQKLGVNLEAIVGTGPGGRITEDDVQQCHDCSAQAAPRDEARTLEPPTTMQAEIARRLSSSVQTAPHFYLTAAVEMSAALEFRKRLQDEGAAIGLNGLILRAAGLALREHPRVAWLFTPDGYLVRDHMNVGLAVALEDDGLMVPVIRDADRKSLAEVASAAKELATKARTKKLLPSDCTGGVFTVSNLGMHGVEEFTAIINPGESAILAVGSMQQAPMVVGERVDVRPIMRITLSSDHRTIDGVLAARFVGRIKALLENPQSLM